GGESLAVPQHLPSMFGRLLVALLLASAGARAERAWAFEAGQALVSVELKGALSAVSRDLSGRVRELPGGGLAADVRVPLASFGSGNPARDQRVRGEAGQDFPEIVFEGSAPAPNKDGFTRLRGTLTLH